MAYSLDSFPGYMKALLSDMNAKAKELGHAEVTAAHLLREVVNLPVGKSFIQLAGGDVSTLSRELYAKVVETAKSKTPNAEVTQSPSMDQLINLTVEEAIAQHTEQLTFDLVLLAGARVLPAVYSAAHLTRESLLACSKQLTGSTVSDTGSGVAIGVGKNDAVPEAVSQYTINLLDKYKKAPISVVGGELFAQDVYQALQRQDKSNPILLGKSGVGKTAMIAKIVQQVVNGTAPKRMLSAKLFQLDYSALQAGAQYQGELEKRIKALATALSDIPNAVLVLDDIHLLYSLGQGGKNSSGVCEALAILKPFVERNAFHILGASTFELYRLTVEKDKSFGRYTDTLVVEEPSADQTLSILQGILPRYEKYYALSVEYSALTAAVELSAKYNADKSFPDKALDLLDRAASKLRLELDSKPAKILQEEQELEELMIRAAALKEGKEDDAFLAAEYDEVLEAIQKHRDTLMRLEERFALEKMGITTEAGLRERLEAAKRDLEAATQAKDWDKVADLKSKVIPQLESGVAGLSSSWTEETLLRHSVTAEIVAEVVADRTGIPAAKLQVSERQRLLELEGILNRKVIGQATAVQAVAKAVRRSRAGMNDPNRPFASFLLVGPSGVGKTEIAKVLAEFLFDSDQQMIRFDMSEYMEKHSVSKLIGAPPGYAGYESGGLLTEAIRKKPYSVLLLDEVEKAHPDVFNLLLQVLDEGMLTDSQGTRVDFKNTIVLLTSNLGGKHFADIDKQMAEVKAFFRPEILNRLDGTLPFQALAREHIEGIVKLQLRRLEKRLALKRCELEVTPEALAFLSEKGYDPEYGARPVKRAIQQYVEDQLSEKLLAIELVPNMVFRVDRNPADSDVLEISVDPS